MPIIAEDPHLYVPKGTISNSPGTIGAITPSDADELSTVCRLVYCGGEGGAVQLRLLDGSLPPPLSIAAGGWIDRLFVRQVLSTGTTATGLVGFL